MRPADPAVGIRRDPSPAEVPTVTTAPPSSNDSGVPRPGCVHAAQPWRCPTDEELSLLARGLLDASDRGRFERRVSECEVCRRELTRLVDTGPAIDHSRPRRFPWVPAVAAATVLTALSIAYFLGGRQRYLELDAPGCVVAVDGPVAMRREGAARRLVPHLGERLARGDRIRTPEGARMLLLSERGELLRFDDAGETMLVRLGRGIRFGEAASRASELDELLASSVTAPTPLALAPRGMVLSQRPTFSLASLEQPVRIEIRDDTARIRLRWETENATTPFPPSGRALERGRSFFWKADPMRDEQAFFVASEDDAAEWQAFRARLEAHCASPIARAMLEATYLRNRGYHLDALGILRDLEAATPEAPWVHEELAFVLDRLGRTAGARKHATRALACRENDAERTVANDAAE